MSPHFQPPLLFWRSCNGERHATKRFRNETNAIYYSFSFQPAVNWSTIGHLWLFCASGGGTFVLPVVAHLLTPNLPKRTKHKNTKMSRLVEKISLLFTVVLAFCLFAALFFLDSFPKLSRPLGPGIWHLLREVFLIFGKVWTTAPKKYNCDFCSVIVWEHYQNTSKNIWFGISRLR